MTKHFAQTRRCLAFALPILAAANLLSVDTAVAAGVPHSIAVKTNASPSGQLVNGMVRHKIKASAVGQERDGAEASMEQGVSLRDQQPAKGIIPIENRDLRGVLFVLGGLAGPLALLFAAP